MYKENLLCIPGFECDNSFDCVIASFGIGSITRKRKNCREYVPWHINMYASTCYAIVRTQSGLYRAIRK